jgi:chemotaxis protein methyltransferase CheR
MFEPFRSFLYESSGIYFQDRNRDRLLRHIAQRMAATGKTDPAAYLSLLKSSPSGKGEQAAFFSQVTVNETYFFREEEQFAVFRDRILPHLYDERVKQRRKNVTIWSAASSSGEEAYSLAILMMEHFPVQMHFTKILGFDISSEAVEKARKGEYAEYSMRHCSESQRAKYFSKRGNAYVIRPDLRDMVTFEVGNLTDREMLKRLPPPDLILCRNALIYFDKASKERVLVNLASVLAPHGYLFLSQTETLFAAKVPFEMVHFFRAFGYRLKP